MDYSVDMSLESKYHALWGLFLKRIDQELAAGTTQEQLGKRLGVNKSAISKWRKGTSRGSDLHDFLRYCDVLGIDVAPVLFGAPEKAADPLDTFSHPIDRTIQRDFAELVQRHGLTEIAKKAFPNMPRPARERLLHEMLAGLRPITVGAYYAIAQACVDLKPGAYLDTTASAMLSCASGLQMNEQPATYRGGYVQEPDPYNDAAESDQQGGNLVARKFA